MKRIKIKVIPNAKKNEVINEGGKLRVYVKSPPVGGKANKTVIEVLSEFFNVKKSDIRIVRGGKSREKVIEIV
ncbi:MAG TPA: DUF167 domain-containing protein [Candidatus Aenigmarchaeota archaeon]|nr:DUF167 domain-containing protein [Candidatus Aenigmarchaeota archaeon]